MVLDDSGSMSYTVGAPAVISSVDDYVNGLREDEQESEGKTLLSLYAINKGDIHVAEPLEDVPGIGNWYFASGGTPLFDGIARSLRAADEKLADLGKPDTKVLHVTFTDGGENMSTEFPGQGVPPSNPDLIALVQEYEFLTYEERTTLGKKEKSKLVAARVEAEDPHGNWTFVYIGPEESLEAAQYTAAAMGYQAGNAMAYTVSAAGTSNTMSSLRSATRARMSAPSASSSTFFADAGQSEADYSDGSSVSPTPGINIYGNNASAVSADQSGILIANAPVGGVAVPKTGDVAKETGIKLEKSSLSKRLGGK